MLSGDFEESSKMHSIQPLFFPGDSWRYRYWLEVIIVVDSTTNIHVYAMSKQPFQLRTTIPKSTNSVRGNP